tara:strand:+ start:2097 stop:3722 length:1626 start_codon:yes stop_codon:yes gene_type:complete
MKISIISSFYNMDQHLNGFFENVVSQKNFNKKIELVIELNKPSTYASEIASNYKKKYKKNIIILKSKVLKPLGSSWNSCIKKSTGRYLAIWNTDDRRTNNSLELQEKLISQKKIGFVYGNFFVVSNHKNLKQNSEYIDVSKYSKNELNKSMIIGPFFMFKKKVINEVGFFDENLKSALDFDFALRMASKYRGIYTKKNLGFYLNEGKGLSTSNRVNPEYEKNFVLFRYGIRSKISNRYIKLIKKEKLNIFIYKKFNKTVPLINDFKFLKVLLNQNKFKYKKKNHIINKLKYFKHFISRKIYNLKNFFYLNLIIEQEEVKIILKNLSSLNELNVIDIGSNIGEFARIFKLYKNKKINFICIEPNKSLNIYCKLNMLRSNIKNYSIYNIGISEKTRERNFYESEISKISSFSRSWKEKFKNEFKNYKVKKIKSYSFKDFLKKYKIDNKLVFHLIKIDAEGYDFQILKSILESGANYKSIMVEVEKSNYDKIFKIKKMLIKDNFRKIYIIARDGLIEKYRGSIDNFLKNFDKNKFNSGNIIAIK